MRYLSLRNLKMFRFLCRELLDTEIINYQTENCFSAVMHPEARSVLHCLIPEWCHIFYQLLVRDDVSLIEAIHALLDAHVNPPLVFNQCLEVISVDNLLLDDFKRNLHKPQI